MLTSRPVSLPRTPPIAWLTALLLGIGLLRAFVLWQAEPMIGLANNYDMIRVQGCIDAYPVRDASVPPWANSWEAPIARYAFRDDVEPGCFLSSEALFAFAALPWLRAEAARSADGAFSLRVIGGVKLVLLAMAMVGFSLALHRAGAPGMALANAAIGALVLADPAVTIYLNTMYAEFSALVFAYVALGAIVVALVRGPPARGWALLAAVALLLACASKVQHLAFGLVVFAALAATHAFVQRVPRTLLAAVGVAAAAGLALQAWHLQQPATQSMRQANLTNTVLQAVMGSASDPAAMTARLGLPAHCAAHAGKTWFAPDVQARHPCPELFELDRARILAALLASPPTFLRWLHGGVAKARPWIPALLGKVEGGVSAPVPAAHPSLDAVVSRLPTGVFALLLALPLLAWPALAGGRLRALPPATAFVLLACPAYAAVSLVTVILGDGFADVAKQFHLGMTLWLSGWVAIACAASARFSRRALALRT